MSIQRERIVQELYAIPIECGRCTHRWNYVGKNTYVACCPHCRTQVSIRKHAVQAGVSAKTLQPVTATEKPMEVNPSA